MTLLNDLYVLSGSGINLAHLPDLSDGYKFRICLEGLSCKYTTYYLMKQVLIKILSITH
jgi:hypothetical protein